MGEVILGVDFKGHRSAASQFEAQHGETRHELAALVPFAKSGGPIADHRECFTAPDQDPA